MHSAQTGSEYMGESKDLLPEMDSPNPEESYFKTIVSYLSGLAEVAPLKITKVWQRHKEFKGM